MSPHKEALKVIRLKPTIIVIEPTVIGTGKTGDIALAKETLVVKNFMIR